MAALHQTDRQSGIKVSVKNTSEWYHSKCLFHQIFKKIINKVREPTQLINLMCKTGGVHVWGMIVILITFHQLHCIFRKKMMYRHIYKQTKSLCKVNFCLF